MSWDVAVIGGGINGLGIARDLAMRGVKVILFEKDDFGAGTTTASSCMMHGGARYILGDIGVTFKSSREAGVVTRIAPHLLTRKPFLIPLSSKKWKELFDIYLSVYSVFSRLRRSRRKVYLKPDELEKFTHGKVWGPEGGILIEEYTIEPARLCAVNAISASEHGAKVLNHAKVVGLRKAQDGWEVEWKDTLTGKVGKELAKVVVNASGPWIDKTFREALGKKTRILRPTKGIHIVMTGRIFPFVVSFPAIDGRYLLFVPLESRTILGTTDDDFFGDPDDQKVLFDEVEYLLHSAERFIKEVRYMPIYSTTTGLRPTPYIYGVNEDKLTREHEIVEVDGVITVFGGKLASYRYLAKDVADYVCRKLGVNVESTTDKVPLPGAESFNPDDFDDFEEYNIKNVEKLAEEFSLSKELAWLVFKKYGERAREVLNFGSREVVCRCVGVMECEVRWAVQKEFAKTVDDVARRTFAGYGYCNGIDCAEKVAEILRGYELEPKLEDFVRKRKKLLEGVKHVAGKLWQKFLDFENYLYNKGILKRENG